MTELKVGGHSPWGKIQHVTPLAEGICFAGTAGHGGVKLDRSRNAKMPAALRRAGGWYEEDCEYSLPFAVFWTEISPKMEKTTLESVKRTLADWYPDEYEALYGIELKPGESREKDRRDWEAKHASDWQAVSASSGPCSWHATQIPDGMAGVLFVHGGRDANGHYASKPQCWRLVPLAEYQARERFGFWTDDPDKYADWPQ